MDLLVQAHNKFTEMEQMHPDEMRLWIDGLHKCQNVLMNRVVIRDYPDKFHNSMLVNKSISRKSCRHPKDNRTYIGNNMLKCGLCGEEFE